MKTINGFTKGNFTVNIIKLDEAILGGLYCVELTKSDTIIKEVTGLCFDAANELFMNTAKQIHKNN